MSRGNGPNQTKTKVKTYHQIRVYSPSGRETWIRRPGQVVPAGWLAGESPFVAFDRPMVAVWSLTDEGEGGDLSPVRRELVLQPIREGRRDALLR